MATPDRVRRALQGSQATSSHDQIVVPVARGMVLINLGVISGVLIRRRERGCFCYRRIVGSGSMCAMSDRSRGMVDIFQVDV